MHWVEETSIVVKMFSTGSMIYFLKWTAWNQHNFINVIHHTRKFGSFKGFDCIPLFLLDLSYFVIQVESRMLSTDRKSVV